MASRFDDDIWRLVGPDRGQAPAHERAFAADLGTVERALDLGCGDGRLSPCIDARQLTLADPSMVALDWARARNPEARAVEIDPGERLPLDDHQFELVLVAHVLEHVRDVWTLLSEARRVLVPAGRLAILTPAHGRRDGVAIAARGFERVLDPRSETLRRFTTRALRELIDDMGFGVDSLTTRRGDLLAVCSR